MIFCVAIIGFLVVSLWCSDAVARLLRFGLEQLVLFVRLLIEVKK